MKGRFSWRRVAFVGLTGLSVGLPTAAEAQVEGRTLANAAEADSVLNRPRSDYDAVGITAGSFRLYPSAVLRGTYDDNVYNTDVNSQSDGSLLFEPKLLLESLWSENYFSLTANADIARYGRLHTEDTEQFDLGTSDRLDVSRSTSISLIGNYGRFIEPRGSLGDILPSGSPSQYYEASGQATAAVKLSSLIITVSGGIQNYNYLFIHDGGSVYNQNYRDRNTYTANARVDYSIGPGLRAFISGAYNAQRYREHFGDIDQNSDGYTVLGGLTFGLTELLTGEVGVGYLWQSYAQPTFPTISGITYSGKIVWNPTRLVTLTLTGARTLQEDPLFNQPGVVEDSAGVVVDYELLRRLILSASGQYVNLNYRGISRDDQLYSAGVSARYLISRALEAGIEFNHRSQSTHDTIGRRYSGSSVSLSVTVKR